MDFKKMDKNKKLWTVHCIKCLRILGISIKNLQKEEIYCMRCAKQELNKNDYGVKEAQKPHEFQETGSIPSSRMR